MENRSKAIHRYILAKDGNRPFLLDEAFEDNATLEMNILTESIAFPPSAFGREAIADTLVRQFNKKYENIYTICIGVEPDIVVEKFSCHWMVVMSEKQTGSLRVGCGRYDWRFQHTNNKVKSLVITIDLMDTSAPSSLAPVMVWVASLSYPWCELSAITKELPDIPAVHRIVENLTDKV